ncbi:MAG TPA: hypothetical protein VFW05_13160 [Verrucomicrobiae bacterium]|nr:hypothetical protein [Verrucomicrobiae bacterium]
MCVVLICPLEVRPSPEILQLCSRKNPHGGGIAWRKRDVVEWLKTDDVDEIHRLIQRLKGEIVIHFRIATVGGACPELRHPFPITRTAQLNPRGRAAAVLFQNGTWKNWGNALQLAWQDGKTPPAGPISDTRAAAWLCHLFGHEWLNQSGDSRWVYFAATQTVSYGQWFEREGIQYSNLHWLPKTQPSRSHE